jgi:anti-sigma regulatory factor (Ser/Thr protein kinase)
VGEHRDEVLLLHLPCDSTAPAVVRSALAEKEHLGWVIGDVMLVASELVTNAVLHSGRGPDHVLRVAVTMNSDCLRISVEDPGLSITAASYVELSEFSEAGVGLLIVDQLVDRWGAERDGGYRVWAEVTPVPADAPAATAG